MATTIGTIQLIATIDSKQYQKGAKEIDKTNKEIESSTEKTAIRTASAFDSAAKVATAAIVAAGAVIVGTFVNSASEIQSLRASFESLTGNVKDTNSVMTDLYELGKRTAFSNKDIQAAGRNYLAAGVEVKDLGKVLQNTADIAGATGADLGQLTLPLTQTIARGKLQTQDFYQILNSGAGALRKPLTELAGQKGFGSLADALEDGAITAEDLIKVMGEVTQKGGFAFQGAIKQADTFGGRMSNLKEAITNVGLSILGVDAATGIVNPAGPFAKLSNAVLTATALLTNNAEAVKQVGTVIGVLLLPAIISMGVQGLLAGTRLAAGILLALGPVGLVVAAVVAGVYLIVRNFDWIKGVAADVWNSIRNGAVGAFNSVASAAANLWRSITSTFTNVGRTIGDAVGNSFKNAVNGILRFLQGKVNNIVDTINSAISAIDRITPGSLSRIDRISIPQLATGGIVTSPTLAMVGEGREPEAVIPLSKLDKILAQERSGGQSNGGATVIEQHNNVYTELDMNAVNRRLAWEMRRA